MDRPVALQRFGQHLFVVRPLRRRQAVDRKAQAAHADLRQVLPIVRRHLDRRRYPRDAAQAIGLDPHLLLSRPAGPPDAAAVAYVRPMVEKASLALSVNEAWLMLACVALLGLLLVPFARDCDKSL